MSARARFAYHERATTSRLEPAISAAASTGPPATLARLADDMGLADDAAAASASSPDHDHDREHRRSLLLIGPDSVVRVHYVAPYDVLRLTSHFMRTRSRR